MLVLLGTASEYVTAVIILPFPWLIDLILASSESDDGAFILCK